MFVKSYFDGKNGDDLLKTITPDWSSTARHIQLLQVPAQAMRILEIGCGVGRILSELVVENVDRECWGFDASKNMISEGQKRVDGLNIQLRLCDGSGQDVLALVQSGVIGSFDFAFSIITFQHIPSFDAVATYVRAMSEALVETGTLTFQVLTEEMNRGALWTYHPIVALRHLLACDLEMDRIQIVNRGVWTVFTAAKGR